MKYSDNNKPIQCFLSQSRWYNISSSMSIKGVLWHSTGANNPNLKRYVQPSLKDTNRNNLLSSIGTNANNNHWNIYSAKDSKGVNAFIGKLANGEISTIQTGPWNRRPWGCGSGSKGSCNDGWIQFEICEDGLSDKTYFNKVYKEACELTAYLCKRYGLNPKGYSSVGNVKVPVILCHADSYKLGLGSNHSDVLHWFKKFGKTMDNVRNDVYNLINYKEEVEEEMTQEQFNQMFKIAMDNYRKNLQDNDASDWSKEARIWATDKGIVQGGSGNNFMWEDFTTREQLMTFLYRYNKLNK